MEKILILGGTHFIGRNLVEHLIRLENYELTLFTRGKTNAHLFPQLNKIVGDRNTNDIQQIFKENWDYVIDVSCYYPNSLDHIVKGISKNLKRYIFISTCSVYNHEKNNSTLNDENAPIHTCSEEERIDSTGNTYGKRKVACEEQLIKSKLRYSIFRPAVVYGQYDPTDRFYYWLYNVQMENKLIVPDAGKHLFSITYVQDLIHAITKTLNIHLSSEIYNLTSIPKFSLADLLNQLTRIQQKDLHAIHVEADYLHNNDVAQWVDLPLWLDNDHHTYDSRKASNHLKLEWVEFEESIIKTLEYYNKIGWELPKYGISEPRKLELIERHKSRI